MITFDKKKKMITFDKKKMITFDKKKNQFHYHKKTFPKWKERELLCSY